MSYCQMLLLAASQMGASQGELRGMLVPQEKLLEMLVALRLSTIPAQLQPSARGSAWMPCWDLRWMLCTVQH